MTLLESKLSEALSAGAASVFPAPDLFARVRDSVEADRQRRRRLSRTLILGFGFALAVVGGVSLTITREEGRLLMKWWVLELLTTALLAALALWLGPFIKRFGRSYAADVFRASPRTGKSFIVLTDIVYYLIFTAYILFTTSISPRLGWARTVQPDQIQFELVRIGGILLIIGILHGLNLVLMPVLGRLFAANRGIDRHAPPEG
jgi:hypothetical protein